MKITKQDRKDIKKTITQLQETAGWISEVIGNDEEYHHRNMMDSCEVAEEWLYRVLEETKYPIIKSVQVCGVCGEDGIYNHENDEHLQELDMTLLCSHFDYIHWKCYDKAMELREKSVKDDTMGGLK